MAKFVRKITRELFEPRRPLNGRRVLVDRESGTISARVYSFGESYSTDHRIKGPRNVNVDAAHISDADDIEDGPLKLGNLAMHIMHAGAELTAAQAAEWYNNTEHAVARGRYSVDGEGVRFDGVLFDDVDDAKLDRLTASAPSGDWRWKSNSMIRKPQDMEHQPCDFVGSCMVNVPGFSPTYTNSPAIPMRLVASASDEEILLTDIEEPTVPEDEKTEGCDGACAACTCGKNPPAEETPDEPTHEQLTAAATLLAHNAAVLGLDEDTVGALTAAAGSAHTGSDEVASLRADLDALAQIVHDAILSM